MNANDFCRLAVGAASVGTGEPPAPTEAAANCQSDRRRPPARTTWQTRAGDEVWIQITPVAVAAGDPKTTPGSAGPLPPNGSRTLPFDCAGQYDYYNIGVYNRGNGTHAGEVLQVPRNP